MSHIPVCLGVFRVKLLHTAVQYERFVEPVKFTEREGLVDKSRHEVRSQVQRPVEPLQRLLVPAELLQSRTDIVTYGGIRRVQCLGPPAVGQRFLKSIEIVQRQATPNQGRRMVGLQFVTPVKNDQSLFEALQLEQNKALVDQSHHEARSQVQRPVEPLQRFLGLTELLQSHTEIDTDVGIRRVQCLGPPAVGQSFLKSIEFVQRPATPGQGRRVIRLQLVAQVKTDQSLFEALRLEQKDRVIIRCVPVARIKLERPFKAQDSVVRALQQHENVGEPCPQLGIVRPDLHRFVVGLQGLFMESLLFQQTAEAGKIIPLGICPMGAIRIIFRSCRRFTGGYPTFTTVHLRNSGRASINL